MELQPEESRTLLPRFRSPDWGSQTVQVSGFDLWAGETAKPGSPGETSGQRTCSPAANRVPGNASYPRVFRSPEVCLGNANNLAVVKWCRSPYALTYEELKEHNRGSLARFESLQTFDKRPSRSCRSVPHSGSSSIRAISVSATRSSRHKLIRSGQGGAPSFPGPFGGGKTPRVNKRFTQGGQQQLSVKPRKGAFPVVHRHVAFTHLCRRKDKRVLQG